MFEIRIVAALMEQYSLEDGALWTSGVLAMLFLHLAAGYMGGLLCENPSSCTLKVCSHFCLYHILR